MKRLSLLVFVLFAGMAAAPSDALIKGPDRGEKEPGIIVKSSEGSVIGNIRQYVVNRDNEILFLVVTSTGGEKEVAFPPAAFTHEGDPHSLSLKFSKEVFDQAPSFEKSKMNDPAFVAELVQYYQWALLQNEKNKIG